MSKKSKYYLITTRYNEETKKNDSVKLYGNNLRSMKRIGRFIFKYCAPKSVVVVNMGGKVGFYKVTGAPEKTENRLAREMKAPSPEGA